MKHCGLLPEVTVWCCCELRVPPALAPPGGGCSKGWNIFSLCQLCVWFEVQILMIPVTVISRPMFLLSSQETVI